MAMRVTSVRVPTLSTMWQGADRDAPWQDSRNRAALPFPVAVRAPNTRSLATRFVLCPHEEVGSYRVKINSSQHQAQQWRCQLVPKRADIIALFTESIEVQGLVRENAAQRIVERVDKEG